MAECSLYGRAEKIESLFRAYPDAMSERFAALEAELAATRGHLRAVIAEWDGLSTKHWRASVTEAKRFLAGAPAAASSPTTEGQEEA